MKGRKKERQEKSEPKKKTKLYFQVFFDIPGKNDKKKFYGKQQKNLKQTKK